MDCIRHITQTREHFFHYVEKCNACYRSGHDLKFYRRLISLHRESNDLSVLLDLPGFAHLIRGILDLWNMNQRGAKLLSEVEIEKSLLINRPALLKLYPYKLHNLNEQSVEKIASTLELLFGCLNVMKSKRRIVGVSKTLHFLLPDLIMPIDGKHIMYAFYGYNKCSGKIDKETEVFMNIFKETVRIAQKLKLTPADVSGEGWNTTIPKLIDNAMIGYFKSIENM